MLVTTLLSWFFKDEDDDLSSSCKNAEEAGCSVGSVNAKTIDPEKEHEIRDKRGSSEQLQRKHSRTISEWDGDFIGRVEKTSSCADSDYSNVFNSKAISRPSTK